MFSVRNGPQRIAGYAGGDFGPAALTSASRRQRRIWRSKYFSQASDRFICCSVANLGDDKCLAVVGSSDVPRYSVEEIGRVLAHWQLPSARDGIGWLHSLVKVPEVGGLRGRDNTIRIATLIGKQRGPAR